MLVTVLAAAYPLISLDDAEAIATVPVKEDQIQVGSVSQVAFEPNTLNYISLQNRSTVLTRELRCRVLTSTYLPVIVDGMASLTILIRG